MSTKYRVEITFLAEKDLRGILDFIAQDSLVNAHRFIGRFENQISTLEKFPLRCPLIPETEILGGEYRHLLYGDYRTLFKISGKIVLVLRVIHGARLLQEDFFLSPVP